MSPKAIFLTLNFLLCSIFSLDLVFFWLDGQVKCIADYMSGTIEPHLSRQYPDGVVCKLWEEYFKEVQKKPFGHLFLFGLGVNITAILPIAGIGAYLAYLVKNNRVKSVGEFFRILGLFNTLFFCFIVFTYIFFLIQHEGGMSEVRLLARYVLDSLPTITGR